MTTSQETESSGSDAAVNAAVRQPALALERILASRPDLYINVVGQPTIRIPIVSERPQRDTWPLHSNRVKAWIAELVWAQSGIVLAEREIERVVMVLVGKAWHDLRNDVELTEAMDEDPLLEALMIFMHEHAIFDKSSTTLKASLDQVARSSGLDTKDRLWPKAAPQLSRGIEELKPLLKRAGITAELGRRTGGTRFVRLMQEKPSGGDAAGPPLTPTVDNSHHPQEIHRHDDGDSESRKKLFDQLRTPDQETKDERH
jgi:hypothetical protein